MKIINLLKKYKEIRKDPQKRAWVILGFYFIFFLVLIIFIRVGSSVNRGSGRYSNYQNGTNIKYNLSEIINGNYQFNYNINLDNNIYSYTGSCNNYNCLFNSNNINYYKNHDLYFIHNSIWSKCDNPIKFYQFMEIDNISRNLKNSYLDSTTNYETGDYEYKLFISTNSLDKIIFNTNTDYDEIPNNITLRTNSSNSVYKINYNLDSYCKLNNLCNNNLSVEISYDKFGEIEEIKNPVK